MTGADHSGFVFGAARRHLELKYSEDQEKPPLAGKILLRVTAMFSGLSSGVPAPQE